MTAKPASLFAISAPSTAAAGSAFPFTVNAEDQYGNTDAGYAGTVHFTSSDGLATLPADSTLSVGTGSFSATLKTSGSPILTATDTVTTSITGGALVTVTAGAAATLAVVAPATATTGTPASFTVTAKDGFGNVATGYSGTVHITSSDTSAALPADSALSSGTGTLSADFATLGSQTITATDTVTASITGTSAAITVSAANPISQAILVATPSTMGADGVSLSFVSANIIDAGGKPIAAPADIVIALGDSNLASCSPTIPSTTIPAGATNSSSFAGKVTATTTPGACSISGTASGGFTGAVSPVTITTTGLGQIQLPAEVLAPPGGPAITFSVGVPTPAPPGGALINLATLDTAVATVSPSVTIPAGQTSTSATITGGKAGQTTLTASSPTGTFSSNSTLALIEVVNAGYAALGGGPISSIAVPATQSVQAQVTLSAAAPQGGLIVTLTSASPSIATLAAGVATTSVVVTAGQLTSPAFTINGVSNATTTITASNPAITSGTLTVNVGPAPAITLNNGGAWIGAGLHRNFSLSLNSPAPAGGLVVTLTGFDPAVAAPASTTVTVLAGNSSASYELDGIGAGATTLTGSAAGWISSPAITVNVANPTLFMSGLQTPVTTLTIPGTPYVQFQTPNCGACDNVTAAAGYQITFTVSGSPAGIIPTPTPMTIAQNTGYIYFNVPQATAGGTYSLTATAAAAPGAPVTPASNTVTVNQPSIALNGNNAWVGAGLHRNFSVSLSDPAPSGGLTVTLAGFNPAVAAPASTTVTVLAGNSSAGYELDGIGAGSTTLTGGATGWATSPAITVNVANPTLYMSGLQTPVTTLTVPGTPYVQFQTPNCGACDNVTAAAGYQVTFTVSGSPAGIIPTPTPMTIAQNIGYVYFDVPQATVGGTYSLTATAAAAPGAPVTPTSNTVTVNQPSITLNGNNAWVGAGLHRNFSVSLSDPAPSGGLTVTLSGFNSAVAAPASTTVTFLAGNSSASYELDGIGAGSTTLTGSATGWTTSPAITINVANPTLFMSGLQTPVTTLTIPGTPYVQFQTPNCGSCDNVTAAAGYQVTFTVSGSPAGIIPTPTPMTIVQNTGYLYFNVPQATAGGTYSLTATAAAAPGAPVTPASNTVTVNQPSITLNGNNAWVGAGLHRNFSVSLSDPAPSGGLTIALRPTDATIANVPASVTVLAGSSSASYELDGISNGGQPSGATTITASAPSWNGSSINVNVTNPTLYLSGLQTPVTTLTIPEHPLRPVPDPQLRQLRQRHRGRRLPGHLHRQRLTGRDHPDPGAGDDPAEHRLPLLQPAPGHDHGHLHDQRVRCRRTRVAGGGPSNVVTVTNPFLTLVGGGTTVGAGLHRNFSVSLSDPAPAGGLTVTLSGFDSAIAKPETTTVTVPAGSFGAAPSTSWTGSPPARRR